MATTAAVVAPPTGTDLRIDQTSDWMHFESLKCGGPVGSWPIIVSGTRDIGGGVVLVLSGLGEATLAGTEASAAGTFTADYAIRVEGIPASIGGQDAHVDGTATFSAGTLTLEGRPTGESFGQTPFKSVVMDIMSSVNRFALATTAGTFC